MPTSHLGGIAVEGLHPIDQEEASAEAVAIADLTVYYGSGTTFSTSETTAVVQFKYSISRAHSEYRVSDAKDTIKKFAQAYLDFVDRYGQERTDNKLEFHLQINRPVYRPFLDAIESLANNQPYPSEEARRQAEQFQSASELAGDPLRRFAQKCSLPGKSPSLQDSHRLLSLQVVNWSSANGLLARARLGNLKQMIRDKAGYGGNSGDNVITLPDVLAALEVSDPADLLPCTPHLEDIGEIVQRRQLPDAIRVIWQASRPVLVHGAGGVGKTVFMLELAKTLAESSEIVFFDCFAGGVYRSPEDCRHLPKNGLMHIANELSMRGICDPILPDSQDSSALLRTFRRRMTQCATALRRSSGQNLVLFLDAIDNADIQGRTRREEAFPLLILEALGHKPIDGVTFVMSSRTERIPPGHLSYEKFELLPFNRRETSDYLRSRMSEVTVEAVSVAQARSRGNPRVIRYLCDRGDLNDTGFGSKDIVELDDLIEERVRDALKVALERGAKEMDVSALLGAIANLPPPIPVEELTSIAGTEDNVIDSFTSDLAPLIENTVYGVIFRDEPAEEYVVRRYGTTEASLRMVADALVKRQGESLYSAQALPQVLLQLGDRDGLIELAFDDRPLVGRPSKVEVRAVRYRRLNAAVRLAAGQNDHNALIRLLVELATVAAGDSRSSDYLQAHPDLAAIMEDASTRRRLYEAKSEWPGTKHGSLAVANALVGDVDEAYRQAELAWQWLEHYHRSSDRDRITSAEPKIIDVASKPLLLFSQGRLMDAVGEMQGWREEYRYKAYAYALSHFNGVLLDVDAVVNAVADKLRILEDIPLLTAILATTELGNKVRRSLTARLGEICATADALDIDNWRRVGRQSALKDAALQAAAIALSYGQEHEARAIASCVGQSALSESSFDYVADPWVLQSIGHLVISRVASGATLHDVDFFPRELRTLCERLGWEPTGANVRRRLVQTEGDRADNSGGSGIGGQEPGMPVISYREKERAKKFVDGRLDGLKALGTAFAKLLTANEDTVDAQFAVLVETWGNQVTRRDEYGIPRVDSLLVDLGRYLSLFALEVRNELSPAAAQGLVTQLRSDTRGSIGNGIAAVSLLARRVSMHDVAGQQAVAMLKVAKGELDVTYRSALYARLARAIMPASVEEAKTYFRRGIDELDAIGSGDAEIAKGLMRIGAVTRGDELEERDFHTFSGLCVLNVYDELEEFPWSEFGRAMANLAGRRGLAALARWSDRRQIGLRYTLTSYLTHLVRTRKIDTSEAAIMLTLSAPVGIWDSVEGLVDLEQFADAVLGDGVVDSGALSEEVVRQLEESVRLMAPERARQFLTGILGRVDGQSPTMGARLRAAVSEANAVVSTRRMDSWQSALGSGRGRDRIRGQMSEIVARTTPTDAASVTQAVTALWEMGDAYKIQELLATIREKVKYAERVEYLDIVGQLNGVSLKQKLKELVECKRQWKDSSVFLCERLENIGRSLARVHASELIRELAWQGNSAASLSAVTGVSTEVVAMVVVQAAVMDEDVSAGEWLQIAALVAAHGNEGHGQEALTQLLRSPAAQLSERVPDGKWREGMYPDDDAVTVVAGMIWLRLGSPCVADRWRAAHAVRRAAKLGRWRVVDALMDKLNSGSKDAGPFQAPELEFNYLHARLWLLVAIARVAMDLPEGISRHKGTLFRVIADDDMPHVLMRHFAASAISSCIANGQMRLDLASRELLKICNVSSFPSSRESSGPVAGFYDGRPDGVPKPQQDIYVDYDFGKYDIEGLSRVFGQPYWAVKDTLCQVIAVWDSNVSGMSDLGKRVVYRNRHEWTVRGACHSYPQHLSWHALFVVAGKLLYECPVMENTWGGDRWTEWLENRTLTRRDGLWLADGADPVPVGVSEALLDVTGRPTGKITGNQRKIMALIGLEGDDIKDLVVSGRWCVIDGVNVRIRSALISPADAAMGVKRLAETRPLFVWLPVDEGDQTGSERRLHRSDELAVYTPWIADPESRTGLDGDDPLAVACADARPELAAWVSEVLKVSRVDAFGRRWDNDLGEAILRTDAWRSKIGKREEGVRLLCSGQGIQEALDRTDHDLIVMVVLEQWEEGRGQQNGRFRHTVAVLHVDQELKWRFTLGLVNHFDEVR